MARYPPARHHTLPYGPRTVTDDHLLSTAPCSYMQAWTNPVLGRRARRAHSYSYRALPTPSKPILVPFSNGMCVHAVDLHLPLPALTGRLPCILHQETPYRLSEYRLAGGHKPLRLNGLGHSRSVGAAGVSSNRQTICDAVRLHVSPPRLRNVKRDPDCRCSVWLLRICVVSVSPCAVSCLSVCLSSPSLCLLCSVPYHQLTRTATCDIPPYRR